MTLSERQQKLINTIVEAFIETAEPVSSKFIGREGDLRVSPATIRNEMSDLENCGYLEQLHVSGGRIPTDKAYRFYVDELVSNNELEPSIAWKNKVTAVLEENIGNADPFEVNKAVAQLVSDLSDSLVIANITESQNFFKIGLSSLFEHPEFREFDKAFRLTSFFDEFDDVFNMIEKELFMNVEDEPIPNLRIFIGRENPMKKIRDETVMLAKYNLPRNHTGSMTIVGPTRMDYEKNISLVKYITNQLNKIY